MAGADAVERASSGHLVEWDGAPVRDAAEGRSGIHGGERQAAVRGEQDPAGRQPEAAAPAAPDRPESEPVGDGSEVGGARPVRRRRRAAAGRPSPSVSWTTRATLPSATMTAGPDASARTCRAPVATSVATSGHGNPRQAAMGDHAIHRPRRPSARAPGHRPARWSRPTGRTAGSGRPPRRTTGPRAGRPRPTRRAPSTMSARSARPGPAAGGPAGPEPPRRAGSDQIPRSARSRRATRAS